MALLDLVEKNIKIEHIEGYLYGIQEIDNHVISSQGATNEYSINRLSNQSDLSDDRLIIDLILNRIKYYPEVTEQTQIVFETNLVTIQIVDWKNGLRNHISKWFIDKHISEKNIRESSVKYMNQFDDWTDEQKTKFIHNFEEAEKRAKQRLSNSKHSVEIFLSMIEVFMKSEFKLNKIDLSKVKEKKHNYPRQMDFHWGWEFDLFHLKNEHENIVLHFGKLLN